jgi:xylitol oxidase
MSHERNWAGNVVYGAAAFHEPTSVAEVQSIVAAGTKVRAVGSRHSFNTIADTDGDLVSLAKIPRLVELDAHDRTVTVDGGITYAALATVLHDRGWALANLASLPHISVAGACATGTHGSGVGNGNLATAVHALQLVVATGDLVDISRSDDPGSMDGLTIGLGAFGVVTRITLAIEPTFAVRQYVYEDLPVSIALEQLDEIMADGYSVSLFTSWRHDHIEQLWRKVRIMPGDDDSAADEGASRFGAVAATRNVHPIAALPADPCTEQMGVPGPWHERLPHFRMGFTPSSGEELQSELFVARADAPNVIRTLMTMADVLAPVLKISEVRAVASDTLWLSPCHGRDTIAFHFTWVQSWPEVQPVLARLEAALEPFAPRPHWGKLTTLGSDVIRSRVEHLGSFATLADEWDPRRKFRNSHLDALLS